MSDWVKRLPSFRTSAECCAAARVCRFLPPLLAGVGSLAARLPASTAGEAGAAEEAAAADDAEGELEGEDGDGLEPAEEDPEGGPQGVGLVSYQLRPQVEVSVLCLPFPPSAPLPLPPALAILLHLGCAPSSPDALSPLVLQASLLEEGGDRAEALVQARLCRRGLVVVASLLENVPNLAGLCRCVRAGARAGVGFCTRVDAERRVSEGVCLRPGAKALALSSVALPPAPFGPHFACAGRVSRCLSRRL